MRAYHRKRSGVSPLLFHGEKAVSPKQLTIRVACNIMSDAPKERVALAQLDRASGYGPEGRGFESLMLRHENPQFPAGFSFSPSLIPAASPRIVTRRQEAAGGRFKTRGRRRRAPEWSRAAWCRRSLRTHRSCGSLCRGRSRRLFSPFRPWYKRLCNFRPCFP